LSRRQDQNEETLHALKDVNAHVLNIEFLFLVKAVPMFNACALTPVTPGALLCNAQRPGKS